MNNYENLDVWKKSIDLVVQTYQLTSSFPSEEKYGLTSQIRRSAVSIASNISEGAGRNGKREFHHFLGVSSGSASELATQIEIAKRLGLLSPENSEVVKKQIEVILKMIYKLQLNIEKGG